MRHSAPEQPLRFTRSRPAWDWGSIAKDAEPKMSWLGIIGGIAVGAILWVGILMAFL